LKAIEYIFIEEHHTLASKTSSSFSRFSNFTIAHVYALYLLRVIIRIGLFCSLDSIFLSIPHDEIP